MLHIKPRYLNQSHPRGAAGDVVLRIVHNDPARYRHLLFPARDQVFPSQFATGRGGGISDTQVPAGQIVKCAEADSLRSSFPTLLGGLMIQEELITPDEPTVTQPPASGRFRTATRYGRSPAVR